MDDNENKIVKSIKAARTCCTVSIFSIAIGILFALIFENPRFTVFSSKGNSFTTWAHITLIPTIAIIMLVALSNKYSNLVCQTTHKSECLSVISLAIIACPLIYATYWRFIFPMGYCFYLMGYIFNIANISILILQILSIRIYVIIKNKYQKEIEQSPNYIASNDQINETNELLLKTGKNFFIKYYNLLKNWDEADILDNIEEKYEDKTKILRINAGKKLFAKELNVIALKIISQAASNSVSIDTKTKANELLLKEDNP